MYSLKIARTELRRLTANPWAAFALAVVAIVPLLYGALYLWAFWDPYAHVNAMPVALVDNDRPVVTNGATLSAGSDLVDKLTESKTFDWRVVSSSEASAGLAEGRYYLTLTIPRDFSANLASADGANPRTATLVTASNESTNYIASQIGARVFAEVRAAASESASHGYIDRMLLGFSDAHRSLRSAALGANDLAAGLRDARSGARDLADGAATAHDASGKLAAGSHDLAAGITQLHAGTIKLASGADALSSGLRDADAGAATLSSGARTVAGGADSLDSGLADAVSGASDLADGSMSARDGARDLATGTSALAAGAGELATSAHDLATGAASVSDGVSAASAQIKQASGVAHDLAAGSDATVQALEAYASAHPEAADDPSFAQALGAARKVAGGSGQLADALGGAASSSPRLVAGASQVAQGASALSAGAARLDVGASSAAQGAGALAQGTTRLAAGADQLAGGIADASAGSHRLAAGSSRVAEGAAALASGVRRADSGGRGLAAALHTATSGAARLDCGASKLSAGAGQLDSGLARLSAGATSLGTGLGPAVSGSAELASGLTAGVADLPSYTARSRATHAGMMSNPVRVSNDRVDPVPNYGTGFAPYFIPLALWIGSLVSFLLIRPLPEPAADSRVPKAFRALGGYWPAALVAIAQAVLLLIVVQSGLGLTAQDATSLYAFTILIALCFTAIQQALGATLGPAGKFVSIVLLMLQLTSSAGTYPIETVAPFFQRIHPFLPMTYAVSGLRAAISGAVPGVLAHDAFVLAAWAVGALALTTLTAARGGSPIAQRLDAAIEM